jgi:hypothetical protein
MVARTLGSTSSLLGQLGSALEPTVRDTHSRTMSVQPAMLNAAIARACAEADLQLLMLESIHG